MQLLEFCERTYLAQKLQKFSEYHKCHEKDCKKDKPQISNTKTLLQQLERGCKTKREIENEENKNKNTEDVIKSQTDILPPPAPIRPLLAFIEKLTETAEDGRIIINIDSSSDDLSGSYKYVLLNPGNHFSDVIQCTRSIIIAGGTMQPTTELTDQLFHSCLARVDQRFYDHIVPSDAVLPFVVSQGPTGHSFQFTYTQRNSGKMLSEFGMVLYNICCIVPAGVVCFLPSYEYLEKVYIFLQQKDILRRIAVKKQIMREPRSASNQVVEALLGKYAEAVRSPNGGALLFSVVGGKLSEGLNFADDLGRGVLVVGMPYPNLQSTELEERMKYLDKTLAVGSGNEYYENLCIKAVNQCIGRSIRHIQDYACVYLIDNRYGKKAIREKLPKWISRYLQIPNSFGQIQATTAKFFKAKIV